MSFLDVICCGFGAIILLLMITKTVEPILLEKTAIDLDGQVARREQALFEIRGQIRELQRQLANTTAQLDDDLTKLADAQRLLTRILGQFDASADLATKQQTERQELAAAKQELTDEMERLLGAGFRRTTELVGGIPVDSEYIIFVIDTSGSMFNAAWGQVLTKVRETLAIYPQVKGIQVMNDMGDYMFGQYQGQWIPDTPGRRNAILQRFTELESFFQLEPGGRHSSSNRHVLFARQAHFHIRLR